MKRFSFASLRVRLIFLVLLVIIPALGITVYSGIELYSHARQDALDSALQFARKVSGNQELLIESTHQLLVALAKMPQVLQPPDGSALLASLLKEYSFYSNLGTTGPDGQVICSALPMKQPTNFADREWFPRILHTRKFTVSEYLIGRITGIPSIVLSYPILSGTDHLKGVAFASLDLKWIHQIVAKAKLPPDSVLTVFDRKGIILSRYPDPEKWVGRSMSDTPIVKTILTRQEEGTVEMAGVDSVLRLYAFTPLSSRAEVGDYVSIGIPSKVAFAKADRNMIRNLAWLGLVAMLTFLVAWFGGDLFIRRPVNRLIAVTKRLSEGDLNARSGPSYERGEIGKLAQAFDGMADSLDRREAERRRAEEAVNAEKQRLARASDAGRVALWEWDLQTDVLKWSGIVDSMLGYGVNEFPRTLQAWDSIIHPDDKSHVYEALNRHLQEGTPYEADYRVRKADGTYIWWHDAGVAQRDQDGKAVRMAGACLDITERKRTEQEMRTVEEQLRQSQKMEAIGRLAGGIAHDFNNLLTIMKGHSQLALMELKEGDPFRESFEEIEKATTRSANLVRQILAFSRRQVMEMIVLDLNNLLNDLEKMLRRIIGEDIELLTVLADDLGRVKADPGQIEQVVFNLAVNARDAMPSGGKLTIETANVDLDEAYARRHVAVKPGRYVMLAVSDTGVGMTPEIRDRVFEPFFTTKEKGKGTGLGLSTVYGIVKQSGGNIWIYSEPGQGTTFKIYLPRVDEPLAKEREKEESGLFLGVGVILVVEDDEGVRKLVLGMLKKQGYSVLEADDEEDALLICQQYKDTIHLMVTDVVMPRISGPELAKRLVVFHPEMKVLYMSGYTDNAIVHHGVLDKGVNFIQKPFTIDGLTKKVREVLEKDPKPAI